jgi:hypothetical protein
VYKEKGRADVKGIKEETVWFEEKKYIIKKYCHKTKTLSTKDRKKD